MVRTRATLVAMPWSSADASTGVSGRETTGEGLQESKNLDEGFEVFGLVTFGILEELNLGVG